MHIHGLMMQEGYKKGIFEEFKLKEIYMNLRYLKNKKNKIIIRKYVIFFIIASKIFLVRLGVRYHRKGFILLYLLMDLLLKTLKLACIT